MKAMTTQDKSDNAPITSAASCGESRASGTALEVRAGKPEGVWSKVLIVASNVLFRRKMASSQHLIQGLSEKSSMKNFKTFSAPNSH
jgi:hypothetical protein